MNKIKVLLAEDHTLVGEGIRSLLNSHPEIEMVGVVEDGREAIKKAQEVRPDIVLMDISMPNLNGIDATCQLKKFLPDVKVLVLSMHYNEEYVAQCFQYGASGYLLKKSAVSELVSAIHAVARGESYVSPPISRFILDQYVRRPGQFPAAQPSRSLTPREREVLQLIAEGKANKEIAQIMNIDIKTVEAHKHHIRKKLEIYSTAELTKYAVQRGLSHIE